MPKLKFSLPGDDRYNTLMSVVALLQRVGEIHIDELSEHFNLPSKTMRAMLSTLNTTSFMPRNSAEQLPFYIDVDRIDNEDGMVSLQMERGTVGVPKITAAQAVSLVAGLHFLKSIPDFEDSKDLERLVQLLSFAQEETPDVVVEHQHVDSDFRAIRAAIMGNFRIRCRYVNGRGESSVRDIDPLLLLSENDLWYLKGYCLNNLEIRTFRLDHMVDAQVLEVSRSNEAIQLAATIDETAPVYQATQNDTIVELELAPEAYALAGLFTQIREPESIEGNRIRATIKVGYLPVLGPMICKYGSHAKVIGPKVARDVVRQYALAALGNQSSEERQSE